MVRAFSFAAKEGIFSERCPPIFYLWTLLKQKMRPFKTALKKLNANKIAKKFHDFAKYALA